MQIFLPLALIANAPSDFSQANWIAMSIAIQQIRRPQARQHPNRADELVEFASPRSALAPKLHTSADSRNSYAHGAAHHFPSHPNTPSATAPEPPAVTRRTRRTASNNS